MKSLKTTLVALTFSAITLVPSISALAQANLADLQATAGTVISVDANTGSDVNAAIGQPLRTLQAAVNQAVLNSSRGLATKVLVSPGEYRETLNINETSSQAAPITFEALNSGNGNCFWIRYPDASISRLKQRVHFVLYMELQLRPLRHTEWLAEQQSNGNHSSQRNGLRERCSAHTSPIRFLHEGGHVLRG